MAKQAAKELSGEIFVLQSLRETGACFLLVALSLRLGLGKSWSGVFPVMGKQYLAPWSGGKWIEVVCVSSIVSSRNWPDSHSDQLNLHHVPTEL